MGAKGYLEREELRKNLAQAQWELERLEEEYRNLQERKKIHLDVSQLLEKEAKRYYLVRGDSQILKFIDYGGSGHLGTSPQWEGKDEKTFWKRLWENRMQADKIPPLDVLRVFHVSFSFFLCLGVYFKLRSYWQDAQDKRSSLPQETV